MTFHKSTISYLIIFFIGLTIFCSSCNDDNFIEEMEEGEIIEAPDTLEYVLITGLVSDTEGNPLTNVTIEYEDDDQIKSTTTDDAGMYLIPQIPRTDKNSFIRSHLEGYSPKIDPVNLENETVTKNIILASVDQLSTNTSEVDMNSVIDNLVGITGRIVNQEDVGIENISVLVINFEENTFVYAITDQDGQWSTAAEGYESCVVYISSACQELTQVTESFPLIEDTDLGDIRTDAFSVEYITISGFITDCNTGEGLVGGEINFSNQEDDYTKKADVINGVYNIKLPVCTQFDCVDVIIYSFASQSTPISYECLAVEEGSNVMDLEVCIEEEPTENDGTMIIVLDGDTISYPLVYFEYTEENEAYMISGFNLETDESAQFRILGSNPNGVVSAGVVIGPGMILFGDETIAYETSTFDEESITGTLSGTAINSLSEEEIVISGSFTAPKK